jgi:pimeloyl-ACP methyl ester carboxylesterase
MLNYRTIEAAGSKVFYREGGSPNLPTILFLHGFPSSSSQYEVLMRQLTDRFHVVAPDYPGFGDTEPLNDDTTFERLGETMDAFVHALGLTKFSVYMFDFGAPVGFHIALKHPDMVEALILQNANAYQEGLGPAAAALAAYWEDRAGGEPAAKGFLTPEAIRSQYVEGVEDPERINPDNWELDSHHLEGEGREKVMLDLLFDIQTVVGSYPAWQEYLKARKPPTLITWGKYDNFFTEAGALAYKNDLPDAEVHLLDASHFASVTHPDLIAGHIRSFLGSGEGTAPTAS